MLLLLSRFGTGLLTVVLHREVDVMSLSEQRGARDTGTLVTKMSTNLPDDTAITTAEASRRKAEAMRAQRERQRDVDEVARRKQEGQRTAAERARVSAEHIRAAAEVDRQVAMRDVQETAQTLQEALSHMRHVEELRRALHEPVIKLPVTPDSDPN